MRWIHLLFLPFTVAFMTPQMKLQKLRNKIDKIDNKIYHLLDERMALCKETSKYKNTIYSENREKEILLRLTKNNKLDNEFITNLWTLIISESKRLQKK